MAQKGSEPHKDLRVHEVKLIYAQLLQQVRSVGALDSGQHGTRDSLRHSQSVQSGLLIAPPASNVQQGKGRTRTQAW